MSKHHLLKKKKKKILPLQESVCKILIIFMNKRKQINKIKITCNPRLSTDKYNLKSKTILIPRRSILNYSFDALIHIELKLKIN